jgi:hypothetical protein
LASFSNPHLLHLKFAMIAPFQATESLRLMLCKKGPRSENSEGLWIFVRSQTPKHDVGTGLCSWAALNRVKHGPCNDENGRPQG